MTLTLVSTRSNDRKPLQPRRRGPYYGWALRRALEPKPTLIERLTDYYGSHPWVARVIFTAGILVASATLAAWIVL